jgi:hypothetical protein
MINPVLIAISGHNCQTCSVVPSLGDLGVSFIHLPGTRFPLNFGKRICEKSLFFAVLFLVFFWCSDFAFFQVFWLIRFFLISFVLLFFFSLIVFVIVVCFIVLFLFVFVLFSPLHYLLVPAR